MQVDDFLKKLEETRTLVYKRKNGVFTPCKKFKFSNLDDLYLYQYWKCGSFIGGAFSTADLGEREPNLESLTNLCLSIEPDMKLKDYRVLESKITHEGNPVNEYYGDWSLERWKYISLQDVFNFFALGQPE